MSVHRGPLGRSAVWLPLAAFGFAVRLLALGTVSTGQSALSTGSRLAFSEVSAAAGVRFTHHNGATGLKRYPELFGGGVVVFDADTDGWPDLLYVDAADWNPQGRRSHHGVFRNNHDGTFRDITAASGLDAVSVYGLGGTAADYDNDGRDDVFVTTVGGGRLFHNEGGGRFADVTSAAGLTNRGFAVSAAFVDYDRDGRLDLYVGNYVEWSAATDKGCSQSGVLGYCGPNAYNATPPRLYRNLGSGRFEDATAKAGLDRAADKAMGVAVLDYNQDGWPDLFVGSDRVPAKLYRNTTKGGFVDEAVSAGVALSENGAARANMGVDAADFDRSGRPSIVVGNFLNEMLGLYRHTAPGAFTDVAPRSDVGRASLLAVTWGLFFFDADLDGWLDIFAANGGTDESQAMDARARLSQPPLLLRNRGTGVFENVSSRMGADFTRPLMARGAAYADMDGDGDLDIAVGTLGGPGLLFRNDADRSASWLRVRAVGAASNRSGIGAIVRVTSASGTQWQMVRSGSSYASQSELTLTFGLGADTVVSALDVEWPSGTRQHFDRVGSRQTIEVHESRGLSVWSPRPSPASAAPLR